ncbi:MULTISPECIES: ABC transporter permease [unclassified Crossiella]|uniref:ABC transporter permease n=1 Tax=unclassified Crossiella TaxID=2620835 RepID=UPI001FFF15F3|nr:MULTISPECIES: ABC transporter permease [unclassified Crossiella]MCK2236667.1 FtsX-like permease family protein [Crossiella sp. S99.2]MCK2250335.1 FtsX-like permease family protein [Crossiella sp. S99.1]
MRQRSPADEVRIGQWLGELLLGARLALTGGRAAWARLMLSAVGIGLGVMVLLLAASVGNAQQGKADRIAARELTKGEPGKVGAGNPTHLLSRDVGQYWRGQYIAGVELGADGEVPRLPPGLDRLPGPGEIVASPALSRLLAEPGHELLRDRLPSKEVGRIGDAGLDRPGELFFYTGLPEQLRAQASPVLRIGSTVDTQPMDELFQLLLTAAAAALLVPIGVFVLVATQIGAGAREQRLASIRLVGADPGQARRIAAGESLAAAVLGLGVGAGLFLLARSLAAVVEIDQIGFHPADVVPSAPITTLLVFGVPATAVAAALFALRRLEIGPLGVVRRADPPARRLNWRLALAGLGVLVLAANIPLRGFDRVAEDWRGTLLAIGIALVLAGAAALLPWLVERVAENWRPPWVAALLAVRRLRFEYATTRVAAGVVTVLIGAIALQVLLTTIARTEFSSGYFPNTTPGEVMLYGAEGKPDPARVRAEVGKVPGVTQTGELRPAYTEDNRALQVTDCATIRQLFEVTDCRPGKVYQASNSREQFRPGTVVRLRPTGNGAAFDWRVPAVERAENGNGWLGRNLASTLVASGADPRLDTMPVSYIWVRGPADDPQLGEKVLTAAARVDLAIRALDLPMTRNSTVVAFQSVRGGVLAGTVVVVLLAVLSLVVAAVDQLQERRRQYSVLAASGVPRRTLGWATLWQNAVPTAIGLALAAPAGVGLAALVLRVISGSGSRVRQIVVNWGDVAMILGAGAALIFLVTLSTLPALRSAVRPSGLRFE